MATLRIRNTSEYALAVSGLIRPLLPEETRTISVSIFDLEVLGPWLSRLRDAGHIQYSVSADAGSDNDSEGATVGYVDAAIFPVVPAGGDLSGTYPAPHVSALHFGVTSYPLGAVTQGQVLSLQAGAIDGLDITLPNEVVVLSEADLPAPVSGVITLAADTVYMVRGTVTLTPGNRISAVARSSIQGRISTIDQIIGNYAGSLLSFLEPVSSNTFDIRNITVQNTNAAVSSAVEVNAPNGTLRIEQCRVIGAADGLLITACGNLAMYSSSFFGGAGYDGLHINGTLTAVASSICAYYTSGGGGSGFHIEGTVQTLTLDTNGFITSSPTDYGLRVEPGASLNTAYVARAIPFGPGTFNDGWSQATVGWTVSASPPLSDSVSGGGSTAAVGVDFTMAFPIIGTYYDITDGAARYTLDPGTERFTLVSGVNGEVRYVGKQPRRFLLQSLVSIEKTGGAATCRFCMTLNGAVIPQTVVIMEVSTTAVVVPTLPVLVTLATNDVVRIRAANYSNTNSATIHSAGITVTGLGG